MIKSVESLISELKLPNRLRDVGIKHSDIDLLANEAMKQTRLLPNNPRVVTLDDAKRLYLSAF
jgi:alcohol dehydrogenase class IV